MPEDVNDNEVDEIAQQEAFEEKLKEAIDGLTQKSAKGRTICFNGIEKIFAVKYIPDFVEDRKMTIADAVERGLKKGRGDEQSTAARLSTLLCVQLGAFESAEVVCGDLKSTLTFIASDNTASVHARAEVTEERIHLECGGWRKRLRHFDRRNLSFSNKLGRSLVLPPDDRSRRDPSCDY